MRSDRLTHPLSTDSPSLSRDFFVTNYCLRFWPAYTELEKQVNSWRVEKHENQIQLRIIENFRFDQMIEFTLMMAFFNDGNKDADITELSNILLRIG